MSDPMETSDNIRTVAHSSGEPDPTVREDDRGSDVGGPAQTGESATENALTDVSTVSHDDEPDDQARNPL